MGQHHRAAPLPENVASRLHTTASLGSMKMRAQGATAELQLYGVIGNEVTAAGVALCLKQAGDVDALDIRIASIGGSVTEGWAIYNQIARHPAKTKTVVIEGIAASMASVIAMVGSEIIMPQNSYMMIHNPAGSLHGTAEEMRSMGRLLDHMREFAIKTYAVRSGQTPEAIAEMMATDFYMSAEQAVALGFADRVEAPLLMVAQMDLTRLSTLPVQMRDQLAEQMFNPSMEGSMPPKAIVPEPSTPEPSINPVPVPATPPLSPEPDPTTVTPMAPAVVDPITINPGPAMKAADMVAIAQACHAAGFPTMTMGLQASGATMAVARQKIAVAQAIQADAVRMEMSDLMTPIIGADLTLESARTLMFALKAKIDGASPTDASNTGKTPVTMIADTRDIYDRLNGSKKKEA